MIALDFAVGDWVTYEKKLWMIIGMGEKADSGKVYRIGRESGIPLTREVSLYEIQPVKTGPMCPVCSMPNPMRDGNFDEETRVQQDGVVIGYKCENCGPFKMTTRAEETLSEKLPRNRGYWKPEHAMRRVDMSQSVYWHEKTKDFKGRIWTSKNIGELFEKTK
jgi:hypothetical protein